MAYILRKANRMTDYCKKCNQELVDEREILSGMCALCEVDVAPALDDEGFLIGTPPVIRHCGDCGAKLRSGNNTGLCWQCAGKLTLPENKRCRFCGEPAIGNRLCKACAKIVRACPKCGNIFHAWGCTICERNKIVDECPACHIKKCLARGRKRKNRCAAPAKPRRSGSRKIRKSA